MTFKNLDMITNALITSPILCYLGDTRVVHVHVHIRVLYLNFALIPFNHETSEDVFVFSLVFDVLRTTFCLLLLR